MQTDLNVQAILSDVRAVKGGILANWTCDIDKHERPKRKAQSDTRSFTSSNLVLEV